MFFAYHGSLDNSKSTGTNNLIKEFAHIVTTPEDILVKYGFIKPQDRIIINSIVTKNEVDIPKEYLKVYKSINKKPTDISEIAKKSNTDLKTVMSKLTMLELEGKIKKVAGNRYVIGDD